MKTTPYDLAISLAKPVVRGQLSHFEARCAIAATVAKREREAPELYQPTDVIQFSRWLLAQEIKKLDDKRSLVAWKIVRHIKPYIGTGRGKNVILAEAHGINGANGFPFTEPEVAGIVDRELYLARRSPRG